MAIISSSFFFVFFPLSQLLSYSSQPLSQTWLHVYHLLGVVLIVSICCCCSGVPHFVLVFCAVSLSSLIFSATVFILTLTPSYLASSVSKIVIEIYPWCSISIIYSFLMLNSIPLHDIWSFVYLFICLRTFELFPIFVPCE